MVYDSMMNKINPRTLGAVGNRANLENDSIAKYAKQINKSGPVNSNTQSRIEQ
jgi:riboflavin synthase alpha subunit